MKYALLGTTALTIYLNGMVNSDAVPLPTVTIDTENGPVRINASDYDPAKHTLSGGGVATKTNPPAWDDARTDGPTIAEYVAAGYPAKTYPPAGYASRSTDEEIAAAVAAAPDTAPLAKPPTEPAPVPVAPLAAPAAVPPALGTGTGTPPAAEVVPLTERYVSRIDKAFFVTDKSGKTLDADGKVATGLDGFKTEAEAKASVNFTGAKA